MLAFLPHPAETDSDYTDLHMNGMWFQEWQSGYDDILRRGYPRPKRRTTVLAELYSPDTPDFLHGGDFNVPFLVSERTRGLFRKHAFTGIRFSSVEIVKVATKGKRKTNPKTGEPEDQIVKARNRSGIITPPKLFAVRVVGRLEIDPDYPPGCCPGHRCVTPFNLPRTEEMPDLWRPTLRGRSFARWVYCSQRFRDIVNDYGLSNIQFEPFEDHMSEFRHRVESFRRTAS